MDRRGSDGCGHCDFVWDGQFAMNNMRQRIALAICQKGAPFSCCWRDTPNHIEAAKQCATCQSMVSRILKVMREPTHSMLLAGSDSVGSPQKSLPDYWRDMIDAALKE